MKICPTCLANHDDRFSRCPEDGAALLQLGTEPDPRLGMVVGGGYVLLDVLGAGGMGIVYRAWQRSTAREVAIKTLHPLSGEVAELVAARFTREARVTASLRSPNTVTIHDFGRLDDGDFYLVMELLHGTPTDLLLETRGALPLGLVREIGAQVCRSLAEAHGRSVVHRDLKPSNLVLESTPTGEHHVKVLDFGVAKLLEEGTATLTTTGTTVGTVAYMSPEQVEGTGAVGPPSDLYSLGITLFELATGERPFVADSRLALMFKHASAPPPPLTRYLASSPEVEQLAAVVDRCLAKAPNDRFPSADSLMRALTAPPLGDAPTEGEPAPRAASPPDIGAATVDEPLPSEVAAGFAATAAEPTGQTSASPAPSQRDTRSDPAAATRAGRAWIPFVAGLVVAGLVAVVWAFAAGPEATGPAPLALPDAGPVEAVADARAGRVDVVEASPVEDARAGDPAALAVEANDTVAGAERDAHAAPAAVAEASVSDVGAEGTDTRPRATPRRRDSHTPPADTYTPPADTYTPPADTSVPATGPRVTGVRTRSTAPGARVVAVRLSGLVERCASKAVGLGPQYRVNFVVLRTGELHSARLSPGDAPARAIEACVKAAVSAAPLEAPGGRRDTRLQMVLLR